MDLYWHIPRLLRPLGLPLHGPPITAATPGPGPLALSRSLGTGPVKSSPLSSTCGPCVPPRSESQALASNTPGSSYSCRIAGSASNARSHWQWSRCAVGVVTGVVERYARSPGGLLGALAHQPLARLLFLREIRRLVSFRFIPGPLPRSASKLALPARGRPGHQLRQSTQKARSKIVSCKRLGSHGGSLSLSLRFRPSTME
jgi:hypothetical protein